MRILIAFCLLLVPISVTAAGCGTAVTPDDGATYYLVNRNSRTTLLGCTGGYCSRNLGELPSAQFADKLVDKMDEEKSAIGEMIGCVEKQAIEEDNEMLGWDRMSPAEQAALRARCAETKKEVELSRERKNALDSLARTVLSKLRQSELRLAPSEEPLLRRLSLAVFGVN